MNQKDILHLVGVKASKQGALPRISQKAAGARPTAPLPAGDCHQQLGEGSLW